MGRHGPPESGSLLLLAEMCSRVQGFPRPPPGAPPPQGAY